MQTQRVNRTDPEKILMVGLNLSGWTSIVGCPAFYGTGSDVLTAGFHGYAMTGHAGYADNARYMAGIWTQAVANRATGLIQVFGVNTTVMLQSGYATGPIVGGFAYCSGAAATGYTSSLRCYLASGAGPTPFEAQPHILILSATSNGVATNTGLVRCLH